MPIQQLTPESQVKAYIEKQMKMREKALLNQFAYIGETVVNFAKDNRGYTDRTGNLVSSTGYILIKDGKIMNSKFESESGGGAGAREGEKFASRIAKGMPDGIGIVVVAGMEYAKHVEATGKNVIAVSEIKAKQLVNEMINKLGLKKK